MKYAAFLIMLFAVAPCISCTKTSGSITSTGDALGAWTLAPDKCMTGDRERMIGATLYTDKDPSLGVRIMRDARGGFLVSAQIPSTCTVDGACKAAVLDPARCARLSADARLTNVMTPDDYRMADGFISLDCTVSLGGKSGRIFGDVRFTNCN